MIFKALFSSHLRIRYVQNRINEKDYEVLYKVVSSILKSEDYERFIDMSC